MNQPPYLTLGMMLGDAHVGVLPRCLKSVLNRTSGEPLVDEIVIGWNGKDDAALYIALSQVEYTGHLSKDLQGELIFITTRPNLPVLKVVPFEWPGRFDVARNTYWSHCRGEWILWLDCDDEIADAGTADGLKAIERVEKDYGIPPLTAAEAEESEKNPTTFKSYLQKLPGQVNVVYSPYNYTEDEFGYVLVRQKMKRVVRRSAGHVWHSPEQSGIHEMLTAFGGVAEVMAETFGFLVRHHPTQSEVERTTRNREIVETLTKPGVSSDPRHAYDVANAALSAGNLQVANEAITQAIIHAHNDMDRYVYRLARAQLGLTEGQHEKMLQESLAAVGILPELRDAYFYACEAFYHMGKWASVVEWYERGVTKTPTLLSRDQPLAMFTAPRAQAALAHALMGRCDKAMELVLEMEREYPKAGLTIEAGKKIRAIAQRQEGEIVLFKTLEFLMSLSPNMAGEVLDALDTTHALDILRSTLPWSALQRKIRDAAGHRGVMIDKDVARFHDGGLINLDDVLDGLNQNHQVLVAEELPENRSMRVLTQMRLTKTPRRIAFYAPVGITRWMPSELDTKGMGGSESSVALLALELMGLGHDVTVFTNKPTHASTSLWRGVVLKDCTQFHPKEWVENDIVVYCRAPWAVREDPPTTKNVWCWHQDNGYSNEWMWNKATAKLQRHLFVSQFAMKSVFKDAGFVVDGSASSIADELPAWVILGNGISPSCFTDWPTQRRANSVIYASNPARGLEALLDAWPLVLRVYPNAHLDVACEWSVMLATHQEAPGVAIVKTLERIQRKLHASPSTTALNWLQQDKLLEIFKNTQVYAYPGYAMAEGFGVALVQAEACGCHIVAPREGALGEVLSTDFWLKNREPQHLAQTILNALDFANGGGGEARKPLPNSKHRWAEVAKRFISFTRPVTGNYAPSAPTPHGVK